MSRPLAFDLGRVVNPSEVCAIRQLASLCDAPPLSCNQNNVTMFLWPVMRKSNRNKATNC